MTTAGAARWLYTQPVASLTNVLSKAALAELLADPANALTIFRQRSPLRRANAVQLAALQAVYAGNTELLARLPINWNNALERAALSSVLTTTYPGAIMAGVPSLYYKFDEAASPVVNYGSLDTTLNGTVVNGTFNQAGPNSLISKALTYNATTTNLTIPANTGLTSSGFTIACLTNQADRGESNLGTFFDMQTSAPAATINLRWSNSANVLVSTANNTAAGTASTVTTTGPSFSAWSWVFLQFNPVTALVRIWQGVSGALAEFAYSAQPALAGTMRAIEQGFVGNDSAAGRTINGRYAQFALYPTQLTTAQMTAIVTTSGI